MEANNIELTGVFVQDTKSLGFTAFFAQLPNIIAEGESETEAAQNLINTVRAVFEHQKKIDIQQNEICNNGHITTKPFSFNVAS